MLLNEQGADIRSAAAIVRCVPLFSHRAPDQPKVGFQANRTFGLAMLKVTLSLVEVDHGRDVALGVAREMVVFMQRQGRQSQYSEPLTAQATLSKRLGDLYNLIEQDPNAQWSVSKMAAIAGVTERTLHRDFTNELGQTPLRFVEDRRLTVARTYLERSGKSVKEIASLSGFATEQKMRRSFVKLLGVLPTDYRGRFGNA